MRQLYSNFAGVKKQAFATPFLPIADLRSWAGTRGSSMRKSRSLASSRALQHGSKRIKSALRLEASTADFGPQEATSRGGRLRSRPVNLSHSVAAQTSVVAWLSKNSVARFPGGVWAVFPDLFHDFVA